MAQMGFFDLSDRYASLDAKQDPLVGIDAVVPWEEFRPTLEQVWRKPEAERRSRAGRKPMDAVVMFRTLVLGALYAYFLRPTLSAWAGGDGNDSGRTTSSHFLLAALREAVDRGVQQRRCRTPPEGAANAVLGGKNDAMTGTLEGT